MDAITVLICYMCPKIDSGLAEGTVVIENGEIIG